MTIAPIIHRRNNAVLGIGGDVKVGRAASVAKSHLVHFALGTVPPERTLSIGPGLDANPPTPKCRMQIARN
jgi:hypothetical protein